MASNEVCGKLGAELFEGADGVSPELYGDNYPRFFTYWTTDVYQATGCYNLLCSGSVQTNNRIAIWAAISPISSYNGEQFDISLLVWKLVGVGAESIRLRIREAVFQIPKSGHGGVIMDRGTTVSSFPKVVYEALGDTFVAKTKNVPQLPGVEMFDTCYNLSGFVYRIPIISFYFSSGTIVNIPPNNFLIVADGGISCLAFCFILF
ncbi:protein ASPARTIC PROTEASE IN GUARD CELL 2-like [Quercus lobata]|uniref:protein ASPARTIC PROTEASE IN GUARD CELL 2-like n=1 Tax=Quercus lobata TaxID=97700 RepID=UPI00124737EC|nr:protein ASPARTIC PROTEASE IN GUARD CELL 2-like [Quercus lobata]